MIAKGVEQIFRNFFSAITKKDAVAIGAIKTSGF